MNRSEYSRALATVAAIAEGARAYRDVKEVVELSLDTLKRYWFVLPLLAAGWTYMVTDDDRRAILEGLADQFLNRFPALDPTVS
jgi:hypothetical protein